MCGISKYGQMDECLPFALNYYYAGLFEYNAIILYGQWPVKS